MLVEMGRILNRSVRFASRTRLSIFDLSRP